MTFGPIEIEDDMIYLKCTLFWSYLYSVFPFCVAKYFPPNSQLFLVQSINKLRIDCLKCKIGFNILEEPLPNISSGFPLPNHPPPLLIQYILTFPFVSFFLTIIPHPQSYFLSGTIFKFEAMSPFFLTFPLNSDNFIHTQY